MPSYSNHITVQNSMIKPNNFSHSKCPYCQSVVCPTNLNLYLVCEIEIIIVCSVCVLLLTTGARNPIKLRKFGRVWKLKRQGV